MRVPLAIALSSVALLAVACAELEHRSAFAGPCVEQDGQTLVVAYSKGGGVFATARDLGERLIAGEQVRIEGECLSACTLALMDVVAPSICWTGDARFLFHAAHVNGKKHDAQTATNYSALPPEIQGMLPPPGEWDVTKWYAITGRDAHAALGRGYCREIG